MQKTFDLLSSSISFRARSDGDGHVPAVVVVDLKKFRTAPATETRIGYRLDTVARRNAVSAEFVQEAAIADVQDSGSSLPVPSRSLKCLQDRSNLCFRKHAMQCWSFVFTEKLVPGAAWGALIRPR